MQPIRSAIIISKNTVSVLKKDVVRQKMAYARQVITGRTIFFTER